MEILVQEKLSESRSRKVFASLSTEVLSMEDVVLALSEVIDDEVDGYFRLPFISARSQGWRGSTPTPPYVKGGLTRFTSYPTVKTRFTRWITS